MRPARVGQPASRITTMQPAIRFARVSRHFGEVQAVDDVSFEVQDGEFFAMLGP